jgi:hypothetical protein
MAVVPEAGFASRRRWATLRPRHIPPAGVARGLGRAPGRRRSGRNDDATTKVNAASTVGEGPTAAEESTIGEGRTIGEELITGEGLSH